MSDTTMTKKYEPGTHPDLPSPVSTDGPIYWIRQNLFSSPLNIFLTLLSIWLIWAIVPGLLNWGVFTAVFTGESRADCRAISDGACWAFIQGRIKLFIFGFYPEAERWRVLLCFALLAVAIVMVLFDNVPFRKQGLYYAMAFPFIAAWLLVGGFGLNPVTTDLFGGVMLTMIIGVTGIAFSLPLGIVLALGRQSHLPAVKIVCVSFIEFIRGVPLITLLFVASTMLSYFLPPGTSFDLVLRVLIMVTLFSAAYLAEVVRGGLQAIPKGQVEAADSLGLKYWHAMRLIVLPQALKISIPGIVNSFIGLFKDSTLVIVIGLLDPLGIGRASLSDAKWQGLSTEVYVFIAVFFFICCFSMSRYSLYLERKLHTGHKR